MPPTALQASHPASSPSVSNLLQSRYCDLKNISSLSPTIPSLDFNLLAVWKHSGVVMYCSSFASIQDSMNSSMMTTKFGCAPGHPLALAPSLLQLFSCSTIHSLKFEYTSQKKYRHHHHHTGYPQNTVLPFAWRFLLITQLFSTQPSTGI